jgi:hypothetical protein
MATHPESSKAVAADERFVYSAEICLTYGITDRALRKWVQLGRFPPPTTNIHGRNAWLVSVVASHRSDVLAGRYQQVRRPVQEPA